jgi:hypothetical protein
VLLAMSLVSALAASGQTTNSLTINDTDGSLSGTPATYSYTSANALINSFYDPPFQQSGAVVTVFASLSVNNEPPTPGGPYVQLFFIFPNDATTGTIKSDPGSIRNLVDVSSSMTGPGCSGFTGQFTVTELKIEPNPANNTDKVTQFAATFDEVCSNSKAMSGAVNFIATDTTVPGGGDNGGDGGDGGSQPPPVVPPPFQIAFPAELTFAPLHIADAASASTDFQTQIQSDFNSDLHLTAFSNATDRDDFHVSITPETIPAPGVGEGKLTITTGPMTRPRTYFVTLTATGTDASGATKSVSNVLLVRVDCRPPFILGIDQPTTTSVSADEHAHLQVTAQGTGPYNYQWYKGFSGMTADPVDGATSPQFEAPTTNELSLYWVRVSNACGSTDSNSAYVIPQ